MDTDRRGFFGAIAALLIEPKIRLTRVLEDKQIIEFEDEPAIQGPFDGAFIYGAKIRDNPLKLEKSFGRISALTKISRGRYKLEWNAPESTGFPIAQVLVGDGSGSSIAVLSDMDKAAATVNVYDTISSLPADIEELNVLLVFVKRARTT